MLSFETTATNGTASITYLGVNINGLVGVTFRIKVFSLGTEYNFGKMQYSSNYSSMSGENLKTGKLITNNLRILLGLKF
jgi:hypothetical protein